jgi:hypothetical protein
MAMQGSKVMHQSQAGTLAPEEPDELIAHVRVCGGCDTRSPTCLLCLHSHDTTQCSATGTLPG